MLLQSALEIFSYSFNLVIISLKVNSSQEIEQLLRDGLNMIEIKQQLLAKGMNEAELEQQMQIMKALKYKKQRQIGFTCVALGALLCVASCLLTFFHGYSAIYAAFILYGMTMAGACVVLVGLAFIFGI